jgi:glycogen(starch) synthase
MSREYPPETHVGGIGTYTYNMAVALTKLGHTVHVITSTKNSERSLNDNGVWVHKLKNTGIMPKEISYLYYSRSVAKKVSQINCQFDIVQSSEFANEAFWYSMNKKFPLVTRLATPNYLSDELNNLAFYRRRPLLNIMEKKQTLNSDGIFTSTRALAKAVTDKWGIEPSHVEVIPNSIDIARIKRFGDDKSVPEILNNKNYLLYFGRLEERKGVRVLAQALPSVFRRFPSMSMVFVGADLGHQVFSMRDYIKQKSGKYHKHLIFYDNLPHEKLFPIVNSAKIAIMPSIWEAFGFVCVEALALGCPVIASSGSGFEEIIEDDISGFLVEPGNAELLAEKIIQVLEDEEGLIRISEGAMKRAQDFEVSKIALRLLAYYEKTKEKWLKNKRTDH